MVAIRKLEDIVKKWTEVTPGRAPFYEAGIRTPKKNWEEEAIKAEGAWEGGVQDAISRKAYAGGVKRVGFAKWQNRALELGVGRFADGVRKSGKYYEEGFKPYHDVIAAITLPPRGAKGDPRNYDRVKAIGDALHKKKIELQKGT